MTWAKNELSPITPGSMAFEPEVSEGLRQIWLEAPRRRQASLPARSRRELQRRDLAIGEHGARAVEIWLQNPPPTSAFSSCSLHWVVVHIAIARLG
jgi:hypothetical protein